MAEEGDISDSSDNVSEEETDDEYIPDFVDDEDQMVTVLIRPLLKQEPGKIFRAFRGGECVEQGNNIDMEGSSNMKTMKTFPYPVKLLIRNTNKYRRVVTTMSSFIILDQ